MRVPRVAAAQARREEPPSACTLASPHSGVTLKTRKRNIVVPVDPASFANAVIAICQDAAESAGAKTDQEKLEAGCKDLENNSTLEFSKYSDTLFEVFFAGGMIAAGGKYVDEKSVKLATHVSLPCKAYIRERSM